MTIYTDSATINPKTAVSGTDLLYQDLAIVGTTTTPSNSDIEAAIESATIGSLTTVSAVLVLTYNIATRDYNFNPWNVVYTYDGTLQGVSGSVGANDLDDGRIR